MLNCAWIVFKAYKQFPLFCMETAGLRLFIGRIIAMGGFFVVPEVVVIWNFLPFLWG